MQAFSNSIGMLNMDLLPLIIKLFLSIVCGGALGFERSKKRRAAGIRTYSMVCLGSAAVMMTGIALQQLSTGGDPSRLGAQVVTGIGFIGAGTIIVTGYNEIKGLTTAAGLWATGCIGIAIGAGFYSLAILSCISFYIIMFAGALVHDKMLLQVKFLRTHVMFKDIENVVEFMIRAEEQSITIQECEYINTSNDGLMVNTIFTLKIPKQMDYNELINSFGGIEGIRFMENIPTHSDDAEKYEY